MVIKTQMNRFTLIFLVLLMGSKIASAFDSSGVGNGGDAVVCPNKTILLDSYEATMNGLTIDLGQEQNLSSMVKVVVSRVKKHDKETASILYNYAMEMVTDFEYYKIDPQYTGHYLYLGYDRLTPIEDSDHISLPAGCEIQQIVNQKLPRFSLVKRYHFDKGLWEKMNISEQALTILHEAWYRIMLENGAKNSVAARYMNGLTASSEFEGRTFVEYFEDLKNTEVKFYKVNNISSSIRQKQIILNLKEHTFITENDYVCAPRLKMDMSFKKTLGAFDWEQRYIDVTSEKFCFKNSLPVMISFKTSLFDINISLRLDHYFAYLDNITGKNPRMLFHPNGMLKSLEDIRVNNIARMYYVCNGIKVFGKKDGCQKGPFIHRDSIINLPGPLFFDENEVPIGLEFPSKP
jgi:hypothetical protein